MLLPIIEIQMMRSKSKWLLVFISLLAFAVITLRYNFLKMQRTDEAIHLVLGSRITISFHHASSIESFNKSMFEAPVPTKPIQILLWSAFYKGIAKTGQIENQIMPSYGKAKFTCPINYNFVFGKKYKYSADTIIVHAKEPKQLPMESHNIPLILHYDEPPQVYNSLHNDTFMNKFKYSIGYRMDSDFPNPKLSKPKSWKPLDFYQKYDYAAVVFSDCKKIRTDYVHELSKHSRVKSFGDCLRNVEKNNLPRKGEARYLKSKIDLLRMFKFTLTFMKFDCEDYFDDQLNHAWEAGTLPVYLGTDSLFGILPKYLESSFVPVSRYYQPVNLANYLETLANEKEKYDEHFSWHKNEHADKVDRSPLWKIWNPDYSPGCQIALKIAEDRLNGDKDENKVLKPIFCKQRGVDIWLGKGKKLPKIVND